MTLVTMNLGATAPVGSKKLYGHAMVERGTLLAIDFSNKGTLTNDKVSDGSDIFNLARLSSEEFGFEARGKVNGGGMALTDGKGFIAGSGVPSGGGWGVIFPDGVLKYLYNNQNDHEYILLFWTRLKDLAPSSVSQLIRTREGSSTTPTDIRVNLGDASKRTIIPTFGGGTTGDLEITLNGENAVQVGVHFKGVGQMLDIYLDGAFFGAGTTAATGFSNTSDSFGFGKLENQPPSGSPIYEILIEDLTVSGRSASDLIIKDWDYVNAIGEFEGIPKRPWIDNY